MSEDAITHTPQSAKRHESHQLLSELFPKLKEFVTHVKEGVENPSFQVEQQAGQVTTTNLRMIAEKLEEFAANLGTVSGFIRLAVNRFETESLRQEQAALNKILEEATPDYIAQIGRFMDRNYVGSLDHERGAVVSGRYVGAIPRIRDAITLLVESIQSAETLLSGPIQHAPSSTIAEQMKKEDFKKEDTSRTPITPNPVGIQAEHLALFQEWLRDHLADSMSNQGVADEFPSVRSILVSMERVEKQLQAIPESHPQALDAQILLTQLTVFKDAFVDMFGLKEEVTHG